MTKNNVIRLRRAPEKFVHLYSRNLKIQSRSFFRNVTITKLIIPYYSQCENE